MKKERKSLVFLFKNRSTKTRPSDKLNGFVMSNDRYWQDKQTLPISKKSFEEFTVYLNTSNAKKWIKVVIDHGDDWIVYAHTYPYTYFYYSKKKKEFFRIQIAQCRSIKRDIIPDTISDMFVDGDFLCSGIIGETEDSITYAWFEKAERNKKKYAWFKRKN